MNDKPEIRPAEASDYRPLLEMTLELRRQTAASSAAGRFPPPEQVAEMVKKYLTEPRHLLLLAVRGPKILGFIRVMARRGEEWVPLPGKTIRRKNLRGEARAVYRKLRRALSRLGSPAAPAEPVYVYIGDVFVSAEVRRQGIGRALVEEALGRLRWLDAEFVFLQVASRNPEGVPFWRALGFEADSLTMLRKVSKPSPSEND